MRERKGSGVKPEEIPVELREALRAHEQAGRITCARAHELAGQLNLPLRVVGEAADALGIKIVSCQLGCF
ncbi:MAG: hypothetical protein H5U01_00300 [Clostridia bacterium]|nr:hypothetical protein [Clostridia bacterium]MBC7346705.1 hypothetical protein [Clostridia bacterium]